MIDLKPTILANETIGPNLMVAINPATGRGRPAVTGDTVVGVSASSVSSLQPIVFQEGEYLTLIANGNIAVGDIVAPNVSGRCTKTNSWGQFISIETASSGQTFLAKKV